MPGSTFMPPFNGDIPGQAVSPYVTVGILVAGFVGGLVIVIAVILFCKFCLKKDKGLGRQSTSDSRQASDRERRSKPLQRYETINSDVFSEPSTGSMEGIPISPRKVYDTRSVERFPADVEDIDETTKLKSDFDKVSYHEGVEEEGGHLPPHQTEDTPAEKSGRYTEGDFHHLKKSRIDKNIRKQCSLGPPFQGQEMSSPTTPDRRQSDFYMEDEYIGSPKPEPFISTSAVMSLGDSPSPTDSAPLHREVAVEIHYQSRGRNGSVGSGRSGRSVGSEGSGGRVLNGGSEGRLGSSGSGGGLGSSGSGGRLGSSGSGGRLGSSGSGGGGGRSGSGGSINNVSGAVCLSKGESRRHSLGLGGSSAPKAEREKRVRSHSHSLDTNRIFEKMNERKVKSFEDIVDYDVLKITEFKGPFYNTDFDVISELNSPDTCKVRYNDTGSIEILNEDQLDQMDMYGELDSIRVDSDDTDTLNGTQKYRELWNLRTTFEEEEECSDTIRMEDMTSPDQSPDGEVPNSYTTSFESNTESVPYAECVEKRCSPHSGDCNPNSGCHQLHPSHYENRRQNYKNILAKRLQRKPPNASADNSFDSIETVDTDGEVSDTSRPEVTTTSFESTTDNTDSTTESQNHKLIQMKADSGYKSMETQSPYIKRTHSTSEIEVLEEGNSPEHPARIYTHSYSLPEAGTSKEGYGRRSKYFERRNGKTASKKRREYSRERQIVQIYESINEPETDSRSDQPSGDSFEETDTPSKSSLFSRFFKSHRESKERIMMRDFSVDQKTYKVFQEFVRYDPSLESCGSGRHRSPRFTRHRLQRKHTDPIYFEERRRNRLTPELRSASLGSDSSASSARRLSPQDSIEEEDYDKVREAEEKEGWSLEQASRDTAGRQSLSVSVHDIPVIHLPEEEACTSADV
ncbi:uncharacterized protein LOC110453123 [Mizuhopecten yessoensis]|uniref:Uncharacterized protein n=1 Tax=Mizuhopecten yessoensis TaxID=6573 RepID=A0A210QHX4_MIZYE|nr:uncharacterized protein LOC110453123 [Mizuhopecten yessoensis]XP_021357632.1 uncharacterized protein LOC110453123 [Mizuhopecten yessoensis]OWF48388.1 hypothetical protein KP79_PYT08568 [Mizuhopecten yessoensis]